jgi:putative copper export protein
MLAVHWDTIRLFLHVVAATIWVGGQITVAALVPVLRKAGPDVAKAAANGFNRIAWPAFGVLIATGVWNVIAEHDKDHGAYHVTLIVKYVLVAASGLTAYLHAQAKSKGALAAFGALTGLTALGAVFVGILLAG